MDNLGSRRRATPPPTAYALVAAVILALSGCTGDRAPSPTATLSGSTSVSRSSTSGHDDAHLAVGDLDDLRAASLSLLSGTTAVTVRVADTSHLFEVSTPDTSSQVPAVERSGDHIDVQLTDVGGPGPKSVTIVLDPTVSWSVRLAGGASETRVDLRGGRLTTLDFSAGTSVAEVWLPAPHGSGTVAMSGGSSELVVHAPSDVPVEVGLRGGAGSAVIDGIRHSGIAGGTVFPAAGWDAATDRYAVDATSGVSTFRLDRMVG